jgi:hypothetical protein
MQAFAGTWKAVHDGKTIIVLRLQSGEEQPSGSIQVAGFQLDLEGSGTILTVTDERLDSPIALQNIKLQDRALSFDFVDHDGDRDKFQMQISAANTATLQRVGLPKNLKAQPIMITRQSTFAKTK